MFKIAFPNFTKKVFVHLYKKWVIISRGIVLIIESKVAVVPQQLRFMREEKYQWSQLIATHIFCEIFFAFPEALKFMIVNSSSK